MSKISIPTLIKILMLRPFSLNTLDVEFRQIVVLDSQEGLPYVLTMSGADEVAREGPFVEGKIEIGHVVPDEFIHKLQAANVAQDGVDARPQVPALLPPIASRLEIEPSEVEWHLPNVLLWDPLAFLDLFLARIAT